MRNCFFSRFRALTSLSHIIPWLCRDNAKRHGHGQCECVGKGKEKEKEKEKRNRAKVITVVGLLEDLPYQNLTINSDDNNADHWQGVNGSRFFRGGGLCVCI